MKKPIKQELKSFALKLRRELVNRDKYVQRKTHEWYETDAGQRYASDTEKLETLWQAVETSLNELGINIPYLK